MEGKIGKGEEEKIGMEEDRSGGEGRGRTEEDKIRRRGEEKGKEEQKKEEYSIRYNIIIIIMYNKI